VGLLQMHSKRNLDRCALAELMEGKTEQSPTGENSVAAYFGPSELIFAPRALKNFTAGSGCFAGVCVASCASICSSSIWCCGLSLHRSPDTRVGTALTYVAPNPIVTGIAEKAGTGSWVV
jgi:hypothetical protein